MRASVCPAETRAVILGANGRDGYDIFAEFARASGLV